jgi:Domain of unknown function (DUF5122) beta-propeller
MLTRRRLLATIAIFVVGGLVGLVAPSAYALGQTPDTTPWVVRGKVFALTETADHSTIYIGGKFSRASTQDGSMPYFPFSLTRFDEATGVGDPSFMPTVTDATGVEPGTINGMALTPDDGTIWIVGNFDLVNGQPRKDIAAIDTTTGTLLPFSANPGNQINTVLLKTDGGGAVTRIIVGGNFKRMNGKLHKNLAALNPDGTLDTTFAAQPDSTVRDLKWATDGQSIFVSGGFSTVSANGTNYPRQSIARLNLDGSVNPWSVPAGTIENPMTAWRMAPTATTLYVGLGAGPNYAAAFSLTNGDIGDKRWTRHTSGNVEGIVLAPDGQHLFLSGHFGTAVGTSTVCTGVNMHGLIEANTSNGKLVCWAPHILPDSGNFTGGWTVLANSTFLWVGGSFDQICLPDGVTGCVPTESIARFTL